MADHGAQSGPLRKSPLTAPSRRAGRMSCKSCRVQWPVALPLAFAACLLALYRDHGLLASAPGAARARVGATAAAAAASSAAALAVANASATPYECLRKTTPRLELVYPADAVEHTRQVHEAMEEWIGSLPNGSSYTGRWMERHWMAQYNLSAILSDASGKALKDNFGSYLPLLVPWTELWVSHGHRYPKGFMSALTSVIRSDVPYVTISQSALGLVGRCDEGFNHRDFPGVLVFSAGGYGHVPIPLLEMKHGLREETSAVRKASELKHFVSFMGSNHTAPLELRGRNCSVARRFTQALVDRRAIENVLYFPVKWLGWSSKESAPLFSIPGFCKKRNDWLRVSELSWASLAPRGYGRTSYRLSEFIRYGLTPIYVYDDLPWLPYPEMWDGIGWITDMEGLPSVLTEVSKLSGEEVFAMRQSASHFGQSHFTVPAVMNQISKFMLGADGSGSQPAGDLRCVELPECPQNNVKRGLCFEACAWKT